MLSWLSYIGGLVVGLWLLFWLVVGVLVALLLTFIVIENRRERRTWQRANARKPPHAD